MGWFADTVRAGEVLAQGVVKGAASGVAGLGDFAVGVGNFATGNGFKMSNMAEGASDAVTWTEPETDFERGLMASGQVVGEVASFVGVTVATAGVGGAVAGGAAVARGGTALARAGSVGARWAGNTAKAMKPVDVSTKLAKVGTGLEAVFAGESIVSNYKDYKSLDSLEDAQFLQNKADAILEQRQQLSQELDALGDQLTPEQIEEFNNRAAALEESETLINSWLEGDLTEEEQQMARERLDELLPTEQSAPEAQEAATLEEKTTAEASAGTNTPQPDTASTRRDLETTQMSIGEQFDNAVSGFFADSEVLASLKTLMAGVLGWVKDALSDLSSEFGSANDTVLANANDRLGVATPDGAPAPDPARSADQEIAQRQPGLNEATI